MLGDVVMATPQGRFVWRKSSSSGDRECVEVAEDGTDVLIRDSKDDGSGPVLRITRSEMTALIQGVKAGEFDDLAQ
jgi:hypothetical protein